MLASVEDSTNVLTLARRLPALVLAVVLSAGQGALCAGWMPTPEARMACCAKDGTCPMHGSGSDDRSKRVTSQAEADRCCAGSERETPTPGASAFAPTIGLVVVPSVIPLVAPLGPIPRGPWREHFPVPVARIPKHLLLSVLIV
jgi:hypothetical protein